MHKTVVILLRESPLDPRMRRGIFTGPGEITYMVQPGEMARIAPYKSQCCDRASPAKWAKFLDLSLDGKMVETLET